MLNKPVIRVNINDPYYDFISGVQLLMNIHAPENGLKFLRKNDCWPWSGYLNKGGYGLVCYESKDELAHRVSWSIIGRKTFTPGLVLDHLCRNRACINPDHLEEVTIAENTLRGTAPAANNAKKDFCDYGHEFTEDNISWEKGNRRRCKTCVEIKQKKLRKNEEDGPTC